MGRRHLPWSWWSKAPPQRAACGLKDPAQWSHDPAMVTCRACRRTLKMADAEAAQW